MMMLITMNREAIRRNIFNAIIVFAIASTLKAQFYFLKSSPPWGENVVTYTNIVSKSRPSKPGYLETFIDPYFGSKITRVSGDIGQPIPVIGGTWPQNCRNHYQKDPPWNADGSILFLNKGCKMFLDGNTYEPLDLKMPPGPARFHPLKPDIMIVLPDHNCYISQLLQSVLHVGG